MDLQQTLARWLPASLRGGPPAASRAQGLEVMDQLEGLLSAGLPLDRALHVLSVALDTPAMKNLVVGLLIDIEKGRTLAEAFAQHPRTFGTLEVSMIRAGEEGGILPQILRRLVDYQRSTLEFRRFVLTSSIYPLILLAFGVVAVGAILLFVLPSFVETYGDMASASLPAAMLIGLSHALQSYGGHALAVLIGLTWVFHFWRTSARGRPQFQRLVLMTPIVGDMRLKSELARVLHTLGVLSGAGVSIVRALRLSRSLTSLVALDAALDVAERSLREGRGLARPFLANPLFPRLVGQLAMVGEESGALDKMLVKVADRLENEVRSRLRTLLAILEPLLIVSIGLVIGLIVVSMIAAIFSLNEMPL